MAGSKEVISVEEEHEIRKVVRKEAGQASRGSDRPVIVTEEAKKWSTIVQIEETSISTTSREERFNSVRNAEDDNTTTNTRIQKVPIMLRDTKDFEKYFEPRVISIGPYHYGKVKLKPAESLKLKFAKKFISASYELIEPMFNKVLKEIEHLRNCYDEEPTKKYDDETLAWMLFVDGCSALQYILCVVEDECNDLLEDHLVIFFQQDLFLLENQLPFRVLELLMSERFKDNEGMEVIDIFIQSTINMILYKEERHQQQQQQPPMEERQQQQQPLPMEERMQQQQQQPPMEGRQQQQQPPPMEERQQQQQQPPPMEERQQQQQQQPPMEGRQQQQPPPPMEVRQQQQQQQPPMEGRPSHLLELLQKRLIDQQQQQPPMEERRQQQQQQPPPPMEGRQQQQQPPPMEERQRQQQGMKEKLCHFPMLLRNKLCKPRETEKKDWQSFRNVMELTAVGIHLKPSDTNCLNYVSFKSHFFYGDLRLPPIIVDDSTRTKFLNLIAYEMNQGVIDDLEVTSYICFLDSLIDHPEDVKQLRAAGIVHNFLGSDEEVAKLFNEIATDLPDYDRYKDVKREIQKHYDNRLKTWWAQLKHEHFRYPWSYFAFGGAVLVILLTIVQTIFSIHGAIPWK